MRQRERQRLGEGDAWEADAGPGRKLLELAVTANFGARGSIVSERRHDRELSNERDEAWGTRTGKRVDVLGRYFGIRPLSTDSDDQLARDQVVAGPRVAGSAAHHGTAGSGRSGDDTASRQSIGRARGRWLVTGGHQRRQH